MKMKNIIYPFLILLLVNLNLNAQTLKDENSTLIYDRGFSAELIHQGSFGIGLGGIIGKNLGHKIKPNYTFGIYTDLILSDTPIFSPRLKFTWNYLSVFGIGVNFANNYRSGSNDFRITPEVNFSLYGIANLFVGYSFNINENSFEDLSEFRIGMNLNFISRK